MLKYVIYGAGKKGKALFEKLARAGLAIDYFCDGDASKQQEYFCGILIISPQELIKIKDDAYIFVSPKNADDIYEFLYQEKFPKICPRQLMTALDKLIAPPNAEGRKWPMFDPGHFYSLYPDLQDFMARKDKIYAAKNMEDVELNIEGQLAIYNELVKFYPDLPDWPEMDSPKSDKRLNKWRYRYFNPNFPPGDSIHLHCMLRYLKPKRIIEVGSGYTSAIMLDINEFYMREKIDLSFIEPYSVLLKSLLKDTDAITLKEAGLQDIPLEYFDRLESGDILFIDSTHVSKAGSDVNYLFFEILPRLKPGVYVHLHDIFYPFEYPEEWIKNGMIWNELYLLRGFLLNNEKWEVIFFQNWFEKEHREIMEKNWPLPHSFHGGSFWMRKKQT